MNVSRAQTNAGCVHTCELHQKLAYQSGLPTHLRLPAPLQARGLTAADVGASARKLRLYRRLRRLDPQGFLALLRPGSRAAFDSQVRGLWGVRLGLAWLGWIAAL